MTLVLILGLLMNAIALPLAFRRIWFLYRVVRGWINLSNNRPMPVPV